MRVVHGYADRLNGTRASLSLADNPGTGTFVTHSVPCRNLEVTAVR